MFIWQNNSIVESASLDPTEMEYDVDAVFSIYADNRSSSHFIKGKN